jgi:hypothetical protein
MLRRVVEAVKNARIRESEYGRRDHENLIFNAEQFADRPYFGRTLFSRYWREELHSLRWWR